MTLRLMRAIARFLLRLITRKPDICATKRSPVRKRRHATLSEMIAAGYHEFYCNKKTFGETFNSHPYPDVESCRVGSLTGQLPWNRWWVGEISFDFHAYVQDGVFIPKALGYVMWVEAKSE